MICGYYSWMTFHLRGSVARMWSFGQVSKPFMTFSYQNHHLGLWNKCTVCLKVLSVIWRLNGVLWRLNGVLDLRAVRWIFDTWELLIENTILDTLLMEFRWCSKNTRGIQIPNAGIKLICTAALRTGLSPDFDTNVNSNWEHHNQLMTLSCNFAQCNTLQNHFF